MLVQNSPKFTLAKSEVSYFSHVGICLGWVWGISFPAMTYGNTVEDNLVHHIGNGILSDLGGIYTLGVRILLRCL